jgi:hypothetical protein
VRPTNDSNRVTSRLASREGEISPLELLMVDLLPGVRVVASLACVNDDVAKVLVVLIASRDNDGFRTFGGTSADSRLQWTVDARAMQFLSGGELLTNRHSRYLAVRAFAMKRWKVERSQIGDRFVLARRLKEDDSDGVLAEAS